MIPFLMKNFGWLQIGLGVLFVYLFLRRWHQEETSSQFKVREADRKIQFERGPQARTTATSPDRPLLLTGIRLQGAAHEILDIPALATEEQIQKAFKNLMKQYHPDKVGRPGSREWQDAQVIAETLNRARNEMLERLKRRSS